MNTQPLALASNIQGALTGYGLDMLEAFMSEPAELAAVVPVAPLIPAPATYLDALAQQKAAPARLPEPASDPGDDWDF